MLLAIAALLASAAVARASPAARLIYVRGAGAESCPDQQEVRAAISSRLGHDPFVPSARLTILAELSREEGRGYRGRLQVIDDANQVRGERVLASSKDDCSEVTKALALAVSIALDELVSASQPEPEPSVSAGPSTAVRVRMKLRPQASVDMIDPEQTAPAEAVRFRTRLGVLGSTGTAPGLAAGGFANAEGVWRRLGVGIEARADLPASSSLEGGGSVSSSLTLGSALLCIHAEGPFGCVVGSVGYFRGAGEDISRPKSGDALFAQGAARVGMSQKLAGPYYVVVQVDVGYTLTPNRITISGHDAFTISRITGTGGAGIEVRF